MSKTYENFEIIIFNLDKDESDEDEYRSLKRLLLHKPETAAAPEQMPSVIDNLIKPLGACANNPCEHAGVCISKGETEYECQCVGPWRGTHCGIGMSSNFMRT